MKNAQEKTASRAESRIDGEHVRQIALRITSWPSETGTPGEAFFANRLHALLRELPIFGSIRKTCASLQVTVSR